MKTYTKPATSKLVTSFDNQLKNLLMEDLKAFVNKSKFLHSNIHAFAQQSLPGA